MEPPNKDETAWRQRLDALATGGPARPAGLTAHDHAALVYWARQEYHDAIVPFIADGLRAGDLVVHVAHDEPAAPLLQALGAAGTDVEAARASGQLVVLTAAEAFFPDGRFDVERALAGVQEVIASARAAGAPQVRFSVDISYLLSGVPGMEDGPVFDARANDEVFARHDFICICAFNASQGANHVVEDMLATHPLIFVRGLPLSNPHYQPWKQLSTAAAALQRWKARYSAGALCASA